jgi:hypothetical protein
MSKKIFISYARENIDTAKRLYKRLVQLGGKPWMDKKNISSGDRWELTIKRQLRDSDFVFALLSTALIEEGRYFQVEINAALTESRKRPSRKFIVPIRLNRCKVPEELSHIHPLDLITGTDWSKLPQRLSKELGWPPSRKRRERDLPSSLTIKPFAYPRPRWLTPSQRRRLSEVAKAAFVLLLFDRTGTGCWGKSYLPRHLSDLPDAMGAITGTPFALLAISSYTAEQTSETRIFGRTERVVHKSADKDVLKTLDDLLQPDGNYLRRERGSFTGSTDLFLEHPRHAAGACLIRMLYGEIEDRDFRTIERLCKPMSKPETYDLAVVCRVLSQVRYLDSIPPDLQQRVTRTHKSLLAKLVGDIRSAKIANIARVKSGTRPESIEQWSTAQWSTAWYVLPLLTLPSIPSVLIDRVRRFFLNRSEASSSETSLLPTKVDGSFRGDGKSAFGSGLALVSWRILEKMAPKDKVPSKQAQNMVDRIIDSTADAIEAPMFNPNPEKPEGYLGWGAICLGAASVGIRISYEDCQAAITLTKQLKAEPVNRRSEKELERAYLRLIKKNKLLKTEFAVYVARAAARLSVIYEPVKKEYARKRRRRRVISG